MKHPSPRRTASRAVLAVVLLAPWVLPAHAQGSVPDAAPADAAAAPAQAEQFTLANGMTLIVKPDRRAPTAVQMIWVRVGSVDEVDGTSGVAHALEHMMFKGTKDLKPGEFSRKVAALGGRENAFTTRDYTGFYQQIPADHLEQVMRLEADRFANNQWADDEFKREIEVVKEERRLRTEDQPRALLGEQQNAAVFVASPYHRPVVGWMSDLDAMTADDVRAFFHRWYVPANAAIVVAGDVEVAKVRALAEKYYGRIAARPVPVRKPRTEPSQHGDSPHRVQGTCRAVFRLSCISGAAGRCVADSRRSDGHICAGGPVGRARRVFGREARSGIDAGAGPRGRFGRSLCRLRRRGPQLFVLEGVPAAGQTPEAVEAALRTQVARIARDGVGAAELARVKTQWVASETYKLDSVMAQARELGSNWVQGLPLDTSSRILARLRAVSAEQVQAVASKYFGDDQLTVATLRPLPLAGGRRPRQAGGPADDLR